jgi:hypothetical protein
MSDSQTEKTPLTKTEIIVTIAIIAYLASLFFFLVLPIIKEWFQ